MSSTSVYGQSVHGNLKCVSAQLASFPVNSASILYPLTVPTAGGPIRIVAIQWVASAVLSDTDGTMLIDVDVFDASENASDALVDVLTVEGGVAHTPADCTLQTEGTEKEFTLDAGDSVRVTFTNNSAAINTNGSIAVTIFYHAIPKENAGDDIRHATYYR